MGENGLEDVYMFERQHLYVQVYRTSILCSCTTLNAYQQILKKEVIWSFTW